MKDIAMSPNKNIFVNGDKAYGPTVRNSVNGDFVHELINEIWVTNRE